MDDPQLVHAPVPEGDTSVAGADSVALWTICNGEVRVEFMMSVLALREYEMMHGGRLKSIDAEHSGSLVHIFRNNVVHKFLTQQDSEWLLFLDADIGVPADLLTTCLKYAHMNQVRALGVNYMIQLADGIHPCMYSGIRDNTPQAMSLFVFNSLLDLPPMGLGIKSLPVEGGGAGCLFIHRTILQELQDAKFDEGQPWFATETFNGQVTGEDMTFIRRIRSLGYTFPMLYDLGLKHYKGYGVLQERNN